MKKRILIRDYDTGLFYWGKMKLPNWLGAWLWKRHEKKAAKKGIL